MTRKRRVPCTVEVVDLKGPHGEVSGVEVICSRCGNSATSYGTGFASVERSLAFLHNSCPRKEDNHYYESEEE